jgi:LAS superfamily LD-carboxypeptidase LdcB
MNSTLLLGLDDNAMIQSDLFNIKIHPELSSPLDDLFIAAKAAGFELAIASGYRSFSRQLLIWNQKAQGVRPLLDSDGNPLDVSQLSDEQKMFSILRWSALPGASRHHWGTEVDVYDKSRISSAYQLQLSVAETEKGGPFAEFHQWLSQELTLNDSPFFRPYLTDKGGVAPEPWHLSYKPLADVFYKSYSIDMLREQIELSDIELKDAILENLDEIAERFIKVD